MSDVKREYLIRKRGAYYRPNSQGYTTSAIQAGRYTLEEAQDISHPNGPRGPRDGMDYIHESEIRCEDWRDYTTLRARIEAVTEERNVQNDLRQIAEDAADDFRARLAKMEGELMLAGQAMHNAQVRAEAYEARAERAEAALATYRTAAIIRALANEAPE